MVYQLIFFFLADLLLFLVFSDYKAERISRIIPRESCLEMYVSRVIVLLFKRQY